MPSDHSIEISEGELQQQQQQQQRTHQEHAIVYPSKLETVVGADKENSINQMTSEAPVISSSDAAVVHKSIENDQEEKPLQQQTLSNESNKLLTTTTVPLALRNRVVSLDRNQYIRNSSEEDDNTDHGDEVSSSDDGSYFSDLGNLPSPKSAARPRLGSWSGAIGNYGSLPPTGGRVTRTAVPVAKTSSRGQDSDLSLSSSSDEDDVSLSQSQTGSKPHHPTKSRAFLRTNSAPLPSKTLSMRRSESTDLDLTHVTGEVMLHRPPIPAPPSSDLNVINNLFISKPEKPHRFPSTSSLVSSSSDDANSNFASENQQSQQPSRPRHRRQLSTYSGTSEGNPSSVKMNNNAVDSELSEDDSIVDLKVRKTRSSRMHKTSDEGIYDTFDTSLERPKAQISSLNAEQILAWQSGSSMQKAKSDIMLEGNDLLNRNESLHRRTSASSKSSKSFITNGLVYSEDDVTDESMVYNDLILRAAEQGKRETNELSVGATQSVDHSFENYANYRHAPMNSDASKGNIADRASMNSSATYTSQSTTHHREPSIPTGDSSFYSNHTSHFKVYWERWLMLMYISLLNFLSDWTCFSVAPIAVITSEAFGNISPEQLVMVFLASNTIATAFEPTILARLGLRRTIVFGSFLLMAGSIIKSGGIPGIIGTELNAEDARWKVFLGFSLVGLSQPLYQCTPALLSCSWFPEKERTFATGVALNSNQLGIGAAFLFGALGVNSSEDIPTYFGILTSLSTLVFIGCFFQFQDAPLTPPSDTARVIRGSFEMKIPYMESMRQMFPSGINFDGVMNKNLYVPQRNHVSSNRSNGSNHNSESYARGNKNMRRKQRRSHEGIERDSPNWAFRSVSSKSSVSQKNRRSSRDSTTRRSKSNGSKSSHRETEVWKGHQAPSPSGAQIPTKNIRSQIREMENEVNYYGSIAPSPMMDGVVDRRNSSHSSHTRQQYYDTPQREQYRQDNWQNTPTDTPFANLNQNYIPGSNYASGRHAISSFTPYDYYDAPRPFVVPNPHIDPRLMYHYDQHSHMQIHPDYYLHPQHQQSFNRSYVNYPSFHGFASHLPSTNEIDDGAEPIMSQSGKYLDIEVRDDQILRSIRACFSRKGFTHTVVAFAASGIVLNTLSTYMDYLVRHGQGDNENTPKLVGIIGALFQILVMLSSIVVGKFTDRTRAYFLVVIILLVSGAFALAECNINLDASRGSDLNWSLLVTAILVGPLQPIATEMAVELSFPLCSNTVLVIQQLVCNLASAAFIPLFQRVGNYGNKYYERPEYTFSFYLLIVIHAAATVYFASFSGSYMRLAHEQRKKEESNHRNATVQDEENATLL